MANSQKGSVLTPTRPVFFGTRSSTQRTLRKSFSSGLILREIDKIRPWNCHEFLSLEFMAKLDQKTLCPLRALAERARINVFTLKRSFTKSE
jgi:hypothetical protein